MPFDSGPTRCTGRFRLPGQGSAEEAAPGGGFSQAENSEKYRLYGELLTETLHRVEPGVMR